MATKVSPKEIAPRPPDTPEEEEGGAMGFFEHLEELRNRLVRAAIAVLIGIGLSLAFTNPAIEFLKRDYPRPLQILEPTESIVIFFRVALMLGAILASPVITYQLLRFIMPGLTRTERRWLLLCIPATTALFGLGLVFTWLFLLPTYINFLEDFQQNIFEVAWTAEAFIGFVTAVLLWHSVAFETPLVFFILARFGFMRAGVMIRQWRIAIVASAVIAAVITPTVDPVTMTVIMGILLALYVVSIVLVAIAQRIAPANQPIPN